MAAAVPSPSGRMLVNFSGNSPAVTSFDTGFIDVSAYAYFRISHTCSTTNHKYIVYWSTTGFTVNETITGAVKGAGSLGTDILTVQARFGRFVLDLGAPAADAQLQCFFFDSLGAGSLKNLGAGAKIYSLSASGVRSVISSDASLTVTETATEIDVTVAAGGGGSSLWEIGSAPSILTQKTPATVNNLIFQSDLVNQVITPHPGGSPNCLILGGTAGTIGNANDCNTILGSYQAYIRNNSTAHGAICRMNLVANSDNGEVFTQSTINPVTCEFNTVIGSRSSTIFADGNDSYVGYCMAVGARSGDIGTYPSTTAAELDFCNIFGGSGNSIYSTGADTTQYCNIFGGQSNIIRNTCTNSNILGGNFFTINNLSGCVMIGDNSINSLSASVANQYTSRFAGGYRVYSNAGFTTGMTMAAGGSSWVAVSDVNVKENLIPLDGPGVLAKVDQLPIYSYNYIGNPESQRCFGPTAQDWHSLFPSSKDPLGIEQGDVLGVCLAAIKELSATTRELSKKIKSLSPS